MNKVDLYNEVSQNQINDSWRSIDEAVARGEIGPGSKISLKESCRILDVGCGPGSVTNFLIADRLPKHATIVGCDISALMVDYANTKYGNERMKFKVLDIAHPHLEQVWTEEPFDKIFSFYCLHWVQDQRTAATNMYKMLKPGGDLLLLFFARHPTFVLYEELAKLTKWKKYLGDVRRFISPYYDSEDAGGEYERILKGAGFINVSVCHKDTSFNFSSITSLMKTLESVNPFWDSIPEELHAEYLEEIRRLVVDKELGYLDPVHQTVRYDYGLITARATRP